MENLKKIVHKTYGELIGIISEEGETWYNLRLAIEDEPENTLLTGLKYIPGEMLLVEKKHIIRIEEMELR